MKFKRRDFLKASAIAAALAATGCKPGVPKPAGQTAGEGEPEKWNRAVCRYCGTGCGTLVGVKGGKIVAVKGDPENPVNRGLLCAKGLFLGKMLYGEDRLTKPLIRKGGKLVEASWDEAMDLVVAKFKEAIATHGPNSVAFFSSGQATVQEGYLVSKIFKGGIGTNNVEPNARMCMASAVAGFMQVFGIDEPSGAYADIEEADTFFLIGSNAAECHPILYSRITDRKVKNPNVKVVVADPRRTRTAEIADAHLAFVPGTDLALLNAFAKVILDEGLTDEKFLADHINFAGGPTQIGYGLADKEMFPADPIQKSSYEKYKKFLEDYTPEKVEKLCGIPASTIRDTARLLFGKGRKTMSLWTMGINQRVRGVWLQELIYNLHFLTGKFGKPGNTAFSLTGQPSACGTSREVGVFSHRLPADMVVANPEHRKITAKIWGVPVEKIPAKPGYHTVEMFRAVDRGEITVLWSHSNNVGQSIPKANRYRPAMERAFLIVSDIYPTRTTELADVVLPSAGWSEKEGLFGNGERRTQFITKSVDPPGEARSDLWQLMEFARRMGLGQLMPYKDYPEKEIFEEYRQFTLGVGHDLAPYEEYKKHPGLMWPVVDGKETVRRFVSGSDPYVKPGQGDLYFYKKPDGKALMFIRPYEPPSEVPDGDYPFWLSTGRVLEHWHSGTMTMRVPELKKAVPNAYVEVHPDDAAALNIKRGDRVKVATRRGDLVLPAEVNGRGNPQKGSVFIPWFDEHLLANLLTIDAHDPISKEPDYKNCACKIEKVS